MKAELDPCRAGQGAEPVALTPEWLTDAIPSTARVIDGDKKAVQMTYGEVKAFAENILASAATGAQSDRSIEAIKLALRDAGDESALTFSAKEMRAVLNVYAAANGLAEGWKERAQATPSASATIKESLNVAPSADHVRHSGEMVPSASAQEAEPLAWIVDVPGEPELGHWFAEEPAGDGYRSRALGLIDAAPAPSASPAALTDEQINAAVNAWLGTDLCADDIGQDWRIRMRRAILAASPAPAQGAQENARDALAWINYPVKVDNAGNFAGYGEPELSFKRKAYGYDMQKAVKLVAAMSREQAQGGE